MEAPARPAAEALDVSEQAEEQHRAVDEQALEQPEAELEHHAGTRRMQAEGGVLLECRQVQAPPRQHFRREPEPEVIGGQEGRSEGRLVVERGQPEERQEGRDHEGARRRGERRKQERERQKHEERAGVVDAHRGAQQRARGQARAPARAGGAGGGPKEQQGVPRQAARERGGRVGGAVVERHAPEPDGHRDRGRVRPAQTVGDEARLEAGRQRRQQRRRHQPGEKDLQQVDVLQPSRGR
jgi:hypothetical protein